MRNAAFLAVGLLLVLLQGNLYRVIGLLGVHGWTPSLILPLIIFLAVYEPSMARGALLAFTFGYVLDLSAAAPIGLLTFVSVGTYWLARAAGVRLSAQTIPTQIALTFGFSLVQSLVILVLLVIFGADPQRPVEILTVVAPHALSTAVVSPVVFKIAQRLHQSTVFVSTEGSRG